MMQQKNSRTIYIKQYVKEGRRTRCYLNENNNYMNTKTGQNCAANAGGKIFNEFLRDVGKIELRIAFISLLKKHFLSRTLCIAHICPLHICPLQVLYHKRVAFKKTTPGCPKSYES